MKTLPELLRESDPLRHEPYWTVDERRTSRKAIVTASSPVERSPLPTVRLATIIAIGLVAVVVMGSYWLRLTVDVAAAVRFEVRLAEEKPAATLSEAAVSDSGRKIYLHQEVVVANGDIAEAQVVQGKTASTFGLTVTFTADGAGKMLRATRNHIGRPLAILIDGEVVSAPVVRSSISASAVIDASYTRAEAERIVAGIRGQ